MKISDALTVVALALMAWASPYLIQYMGNLI